MREKKQQGGSVKPIFKLLLQLSDAGTTLGFSTGETWVLGNVCLRWRADSRLVSASICVPSVRAAAFSWVVALREEHPHTARGPHRDGFKAFQDIHRLTGTQCTHRLVWPWVLTQNNARWQHEYTPGEGRTTTSELSEHLFSAGFHLSHPPEESDAKLWHLCTPVLQFSREKWLPVMLHPCRFLCSSFSPRLFKSTSHRAAAFPTGNKLQGT